MWVLIIVLTAISPSSNVKVMNVITQSVKTEKTCQTIAAEAKRLAYTAPYFVADVRHSCIREEIQKAPARNVL